ncbi:MAG: radical SAM protein [Candidatus Omnitrophota bacterium]
MTCLYASHISYSEFTERIYKTAHKKRIPVSGTWEISFACNLSCVHCYCPKHASPRPLGIEKMRRLIDQISENGCLWLLFTGGEPLYHPDFTKIYAYAKKKGILTTLFTNATLITDEIADFLREYPPLNVEISLYGIKSSTYEAVTGVTGSFKACLEGINRLIERKVKFSLKTMALTINLAEIEAISRYAEDLGVSFRIDASINSTIESSSAPCRYRISPQEAVGLDFSNKKRSESWNKFLKQYPLNNESGNIYNCSAGVTSFHIDPEGNLSPCVMARKPSCDITAGPFGNAWNNDIAQALKEKLSYNNPCRICQISNLCSQCPGWSQFEHNDNQATVSYLCQTAHLRAEKLGLALKAKIR